MGCWEKEKIEIQCVICLINLYIIYKVSILKVQTVFKLIKK